MLLSSFGTATRHKTTGCLSILQRKFLTQLRTTRIRYQSTIDLNDARLNKLPPTGTQTKIVCTIGPSTDQPDKIGELLRKGMHVARLNFSHSGNDYSYPQKLVDMLRAVKGNHLDLNIGSDIPLPNNLRGILVDTKVRQ